MTMTVHTISSTLDHGTDGDLNPDPWDIVIHIWPRINYFLVFFKVELLFYANRCPQAGSFCWPFELRKWGVWTEKRVVLCNYMHSNKICYTERNG